MAQMYGMGAQARLGSDLAGAGMFTQLLGAGASAIPSGTFSSLGSTGGGGYTGGGTFKPGSSSFPGSPHLRSA